MAKSCALPKSFFPVKFHVKSPVHALKLARKLIRPFKNWTVGELAVRTIKDTYIDAFGQKQTGTDIEGVEPKSPKAEAFCALGALKRVNTKHAKAAQKFLELAAFKILDIDPSDSPCDENIFDLNDGSGSKQNHKEVLKMFTLAIKLAKRAAKRR